METVQELYTTQMRRIEALARQLLGFQFSDPGELWEFELALANIQIELQNSIKEAKNTQTKLHLQIKSLADEQEGNWKVQIQDLQTNLGQLDRETEVHNTAFELARGLGDSLAWTLLRRDPKFISPLTENLPVGATSSGVSLTGVISAAEMLAARGLGFPVLHDITNILRVGDITFVFPKEEPVTVEVKTHIAERHDDNLRVNVQVHGVFSARGEERFRAALHSETVNVPNALSVEQPEQRKPRRDRRLPQQLKRMQRALLFQTTELEKLLELENENTVVVQHMATDDAFHWDLIRNLLMKAKVEGYAAQAVDEAIHYTVMYNEIPLDYYVQQNGQLPFEDRMKADLSSSPILFSDRSKNVIQFGVSLHHVLGHSIPGTLPFFQYPLPIDLLIDMMWQRLLITVNINVGRFVEALEREGFQVSIPEDGDQFLRDFLIISMRTVLSDEKVVDSTLTHLRRVVERVFYEFLSLKGFVNIILHMAKTNEAIFRSDDNVVL